MSTDLLGPDLSPHVVKDYLVVMMMMLMLMLMMLMKVLMKMLKIG